MRVSIIIPNFNGKDLLEKNLPSVIKAQENPKNNIFEIIIVDNGSKDESVNYLNQNFKDKFKLIRNTVNRGFSSAINIGVKSSKGDFILLLNNDVMPEVDFLESIEEIFADQKVFGVSLHEKNHGPSRASFQNGIIDIGFTKPESKNKELTFYVSGAAGIFRKSIWQELGGMDEKLLSPFYWEDIDLCFRASKRGYTNIWFPDGHVVHNHESTSSKLPKKYVARIKERNQLLMLWKNIHSKPLMRKHVNALSSRLFKSPGYFLILFMALSKLGTVLKLRYKEIKECVVSDEAVFQKYQ
ncbi:MAG: glycosyl transferase family protein [uncultured bacterium]|nr:MAG: glycosyl transferase family protein [uncultured bacterium]